MSLKIFDITGREVSTLIKQDEIAGEYKIKFNGNKYPGGVYFYKLETGGFKEILRMILLK